MTMRGLKARLAQIIHDRRGFRGNIDGIIEGALTGWVASTRRGGAPVTVGVFTSRGQIAEAAANIHRADLEAAGIGDGWHGFAIRLDEGLLQTIQAGGGSVAVRVVGPRRFEVGRWQIAAGRGGPLVGLSAPSTPEEELRRLVYGSTEQLTRLLQAQDGAMLPEASSAPGPAWQDLLFGQRNLVQGGNLPPTMTAYSDYVRYRYRIDKPFPVTAPGVDIATEAEHYLNWYIAGYSTMRNGLRVPLSAAQIHHLNAPVVMGGKRDSLSRATWMFLHGVPPILHSMNFDNPDWVNWAIYWWSINQAKALHVEDCLVPQVYVDRLREVPAGWQGQPWAPSDFMLRLRNEWSVLQALDLGIEENRRLLALSVILMAAQRPDYLRYLPDQILEAAFATGPQGPDDTPFARFCAAQSPDGELSGVTRERFARALRLKGFDLDRRAFLGFTPEGNRLEAAMLPAPGGERVDIQMIGPFEKASGLGQATRLSASIMQEAVAGTGLTLNCVDFDLDNPAPEGFSRVGDLGGYRPARINLLHLNGESIPLSYAYQPDVLSGAYNIGYFFWEIDSPAACHYLGMNLLDEIWVSTEYGVQIYRPHTGAPVTNVGMCFEDLPEIPRAEARAMLADRFGFSPEDFVFLVAFDSFSFIQRKNPIGTLKAFLRAFPDDPDVRLVIKTQNRTRVADPVQVATWAEVDALIGNDSRIAVLDETLSYDDLLRLKKGSDAYVSLHRSEGWGFGMIEAMNLRVPVVATGYSGNMEFCSPETAFLVGFEEIEMKPDDYIFVRPDQHWAEPDIDDAARQLRAVRSDRALREARVQAAWTNVRAHFSVQAIGARYGARLQEIMAGLDRA